MTSMQGKKQTPMSIEINSVHYLDGWVPAISRQFSMTGLNLADASGAFITSNCATMPCVFMRIICPQAIIT